MGLDKSENEIRTAGQVTTNGNRQAERLTAGKGNPKHRKKIAEPPQPSEVTAAIVAKYA
jgi:hypothetical protein